MLDRIVLSDNGTLTDITEATHTYSTTGTLHSFVAAEDALYIGSRFPMSEKFFKATGGIGGLTVKYWDGDGFREVVDMRDLTNGWSQDGYIKIVPDRDHSWQSADTADVPLLSNITIYCQYWMQITVDTDAPVDLAWIGDLFCQDDDIGAEYPDLNRSTVKDGFTSGKTDWEEQRAVASQFMVEDLIGRATIKSSNQLFEVERFRRTCVSRVAEVIFSAFGSDYEDDRNKARKLYSERFNQLHVLRDENSDGLEQASESLTTNEIFLHG
jgi:hypothetical protein